MTRARTFAYFVLNFMFYLSSVFFFFFAVSSKCRTCETNILLLAVVCRFVNGKKLCYRYNESGSWTWFRKHFLAWWLCSTQINVLSFIYFKNIKHVSKSKLHAIIWRWQDLDRVVNVAGCTEYQEISQYYGIIEMVRFVLFPQFLIDSRNDHALNNRITNKKLSIHSYISVYAVQGLISIPL